MSLNVHPLTNDPTAAWAEISKTQHATEINMYPPTDCVSPNKIRIVCMSDTHGLQSKFDFSVPNGEIFIHGGDFTNTGAYNEVMEFNEWIGTLPHKHKIVIAGNHELSFDNTCSHMCKNLSDAHGNVVPDMRKLLTNCTYIEDQLIEVCGLRIYGSPWQPEFGNWAFNLPRGKACLDKWDLIPNDVDILITHGPALGHGDLCRFGLRAGCVELLTTIQQRVKPKYHIFGHIHEDYGVLDDGQILYINASTCDFNYRPINPPITLDIELPNREKNSSHFAIQ